jgi:peptidoglycan/xylan/chitin deacetylase (PgdA/CDA1 family)
VIAADQAEVTTKRSSMRRSSARRNRRETADNSAVLVYHRVGTSQSDPLGLNVTPANLEAHLAVIATAWRPISLTDLTDILLERGAPPAGSLVVTFDDGYTGVLSHALPLLGRYEVPATAFIVSGFVGGAFWWETLDALVRSSRSSPAQLELDAGGRHIRSSRSLLRLRRRSVPPLDELFYGLCRSLRSASPAERARALADVAAWSDVDVELEGDRRPLWADGLRQLAASGIVEIGGHTVTHPVLAQLSPTEQYREIAGGKAALEELLGRGVGSFAYPYGGPAEYDKPAVESVHRAGYDRACANIQKPVRGGADVFELPRLIVGDWDGATFARRLEQWLGRARRN